MRRSELLASEAETLVHEQAPREVIAAKYLEAAHATEEELRATDTNKDRTRGILAVSASALFFKAGDSRNATRIATEFEQTTKGWAQSQLLAILEATANNDKENRGKQP